MASDALQDPELANGLVCCGGAACLPIGPELSYLEAHHHSGARALDWVVLDPAQFTAAGVEQSEHGAQVGAKLRSGFRR